MNYLDTPAEKLSGVGMVRAAKLAKLGIFTIGDLINFFPRSYEKRGNVKLISEITSDEPVSVILTVGSSVKTAKIKNRLTISKFRAFDESGSVEVVFFNSPYVKDIFTVGAEFRFFGKFSYSKSKLQLTSPKYEPYIASLPLPDFVPIYHLTEGITSKIIDKLILSVIDEALSNINDPLPEKIRLENGLPTLRVAVKNAHFPENEDMLHASLKRLAFDEMLLFGLGIALQSKYKEHGEGIRFSKTSLTPFTELLPYELTDDQKSAVNDIYRDTVFGHGGIISPMARIIVGDVGSGKTVCASAAIYICASSGYQSALMVPTEILARQHYAEMKELFEKLGIKVELLLGTTSAKEKRRIYESISNGETDVLIGTHALISDKVAFKNLGLIITDEQHRFGVAQRAVLKERSKSAHMLVMSATPIPRTLALAMYGDLDVSRITTMPKGRMRVDTFVVNESYRIRLNDFIKKQVQIGGQCYIVCPAIEAKEEDVNAVVYTPSSITAPINISSSDASLKNATDYTEELKASLPSLKIECLHSKMKAAQKDEIMHRFSEGLIDVLVSTTVIEVGINVPNATLMVVENAERFGLSQLHQLRGRVGRGKKKSYCVLVSEGAGERAMERLSVMKTTYDGYEIADRDLALRGPGDFFINNTDDNLRQSGGFDFKFAKLCDDRGLFDAAFTAAKIIVLEDPLLEAPEHLYLKNSLIGVLSKNTSTIS